MSPSQGTPRYAREPISGRMRGSQGAGGGRPGIVALVVDGFEALEVDTRLEGLAGDREWYADKIEHCATQSEFREVIVDELDESERRERLRVLQVSGCGNVIHTHCEVRGIVPTTKQAIN